MGKIFMSGSRININSATLDQMIDFFKNKGIINSKKLAESIIQYRIDNGAFMSIDGLLNVNGITNKTLDKLRSLVTTRNISDDFANFVMESIKGYNSEITLHEVTESLYGDEYFYALYLSDYQQSKKSRIPGQNKETIASLVHNMFPLLPKEELSEYFSDDEMFFDWYNARLNSLISFYAQRNGKSFSDAKEELSDRRKLEVTKKLYSEHMRSNSNDGQLIDYVCFKKNDSLENVIKYLSSDYIHRRRHCQYL